MSEKESERKDYVYVWERAMNSGIIVYEDSTLESVKRSIYRKNTKNTIIEGRIVHEDGERN